MTSLFEKLKNQEISSPIQKGFQLEEWTNQSVVDSRDWYIKLAGCIIFTQLELVRSKLKPLMENLRKINYIDLMRLNIGILNRNHYILDIEGHKKLGAVKNISEIRLDNNPLGNKYTLEELSISSIDMCVKSIVSLLELSNSQVSNPVKRDEVKFIEELNYLSQMYSMYEELWKEIRYENKICKLDGKSIIFQDIGNDKNQAWLCGLHRKNKLGINHSVFSDFKLDSGKEFLIFKNNAISRCKFKELAKKLQLSLNIDYENFHNAKIWEMLPIVSRRYKEDIFKIFEVFSQLKTLAFSLNEQCPKDTNTVGENEKLLEYAPLLDFSQLKRCINKNLGLKKKEFDNIFSELSFSKNKDIWVSPVLKFDSSFCILFHPIIYPNVDRVIEKLLLNKKVDLSDKGLGYEKFLEKRLNAIMKENPFLDQDYQLVCSKKVKVNNHEEEIDLLLRIGDLIIVGELKNNQYPESVTLLDRCLSYLEKGSNQVKRKRTFLENNIEDVFNCLGWEYSGNYSFKEVLIVNNYFGVGYSLYGVPIIDSSVLFNYFKNPTRPIISHRSGISGSLEHVAYLQLYSSKESLINGFSIYVDDPPEVFNTKHNELIYDCLTVPNLYGLDIKNIKSRVNTYKNIFDHKFNFELKITDPLKLKDNVDIII